MNGDAGDLRKALLDAIFERCGNVVDASDGEVALHNAVAGNEDVVFDLADTDIVAIDELIVGVGHAVEEQFD